MCGVCLLLVWGECVEFEECVFAEVSVVDGEDCWFVVVGEFVGVGCDVCCVVGVCSVVFGEAVV